MEPPRRTPRRGADAILLAASRGRSILLRCSILRQEVFEVKTATDRPTRVAADLMDAAAVEGERQSRSAKQQLDHWARVGRAVSAQTSAARRRVEAALAGELDEADLDAEEQVVFNAELDTSISEAARTIRFGEILAARGVTTVALDEHGRLTRYHPDGTTSPLE